MPLRAVIVDDEELARAYLRELLRADKPSLGTHLACSWPGMIEIVGHSRMFDYVEFVAEYAPYDLYALDNMARAIEPSPSFTGLIKNRARRRPTWRSAP